MMRLIGLSFAVLLSGMKLASADPVAWTERCLEEAEKQMQERPAQLTVNFDQCFSTILTYCKFAEESEGCFAELTNAFTSKAALIVAKMPDAVSRNSVLQRRYSDQLRLSDPSRFFLQCPSQLSSLGCQTWKALRSYQYALRLPEWVSMIEEDK